MPRSRDDAVNVLGSPLAPCNDAPRTGFYRNGCCDTGPDDTGLHTVCAVMTEPFLVYSRLSGNDLSTPQPESGFPGLVPGDHWCLCVGRWREAGATLWDTAIHGEIRLVLDGEHVEARPFRHE